MRCDDVPCIFSGAGLSIPAPASLAGGPWLRDVVLACCARAADRFVRGTGRAALQPDGGGRPVGEDWKLEFVLGRLVETAGPSALDLLRCLRVPVPNEAHMLAAWCLAQGGLHATVNFDRGIDRAYELLRGEADLPPQAPAPYRRALERWREALPAGVRPLRVVVTAEDEEAWVRRPSDGSLFKLHGSLRLPGHEPTGVIVSDFLEYLPLRAAQRRLLDALCARPLVVTGYSGGDADLHAPLLDGLVPDRTLWTDPAAGAAMQEAAARGVPVAAMTAVEALRARAPLEHLPPWPAQATGFEPDLRAETSRWAAGVDSFAAAHAWAWMLIDSGRHAAAIRLCERLVEVSRSIDVRRRLADAYFMRGTAEDKRTAIRHYRRVLRPGPGAPAVRSYAVLRLGACHRTLALAGDRTSYRHVLAAIGYALASIAWNRIEGDSPAARGEALASLGHLALRLAELQMSGRHALPSSLVRPVLRLGLRAQATSQHAGGHAVRFGRQQQIEMRCLLELAAGRAGAHSDVAAKATKELQALERDYRNLNNPIGAANSRAAQALAALAGGDAAGARRRLDEAEALYRDAGALRGSGGRLLVVRRALVDRGLETFAGP